MKVNKWRFFMVLAVAGMIAFMAGCGGDTAEDTGGSSAESEDNSTDSEDAEANDSSYPEESIEVVVPAGAGGDTDRNTRTLTQHLEGELGVDLVVQNVEGSGGSTGSSEILNADPDGYRVLAYHDGALINKLLGLTDYEVNDFEVAGISVLDQGNSFLVSGESEFNSLEDMVKYAEENPGELAVATETGSFTHLQLLALQEEAGVEFNIVDAGGASDKITALLGGQVDVVPTQIGLVGEYIESGEMKSLGVMAEERLEQFPEVPTFTEQGYDVQFDKIFFWAFPPETPENIVNTFSEAMETVVTENEEYREEINGHVVSPEYMGPEEASEFIAETQKRYQEIYENSEQ
ncbi:tripartite tricarboxylate transporter substrate binding protein [Salibacterium aidingense]|uniref:tripartite tricarboxylate transporter substrate binding protein n=1 Tax=Salibacterium aidingense TaxID=384933 RepID=UPI0003FE9FA6|nr:tripartite tricarboxylate transporter substrate binding protein [Salibacterium aidingense]